MFPFGLFLKTSSPEFISLLEGRSYAHSLEERPQRIAILQKKESEALRSQDLKEREEILAKRVRQVPQYIATLKSPWSGAKHYLSHFPTGIRGPSEWGYRPTWPRDPDDLACLPPPPRATSAFWSHGAGSDSWFLEAGTPSAHDAYMDFYVRNLRPKTY